MIKYHKIYTQYAKITFKAISTYRANFITFSIITLASNLFLPLLTLLIYQMGASYPGWTFHEALLVQSVFMLSMGVSSTFFYNIVWTVMGNVKEGSFDLVMLKPGSIIFVLLASSLNLESVGTIIGGMTMFVYALHNLPNVSILGFLQFIFLFLMGIIVQLGLIMIMAASAFKWVGNSRIFEIFDSITSFGAYPSAIFSKTVVYVITYMIPVAMFGFFPSSALLGRTDISMFISAIPCVAFMLFGVWIFRKMIKLYQSAGG